jgi:hypothetical protein
MPELQHWNRPGTGRVWDRVKLGGKLMPGVATVEVDSELAKLDIKKAKGQQKAKQTNEGPDNAKVSISLQLEPDEDLVLLKDILPILRPSVGRKPSEPQAIEHPNCEAAGVGAVVIERVKWAHPDPVRGWLISLSCTEFVAQPKPSGGLGKGKKTSAKRPCAQLANDAQDAYERFRQAEIERNELERKAAKGSGVLLKRTEVALLDMRRRKYTQAKNEYDAAEAAADRCAGAKPPSSTAKQNTV